MPKQNRPALKFYLAVFIFSVANIMSYFSMVAHIAKHEYGNLGEYGLWIYIASMVLLPISAFRLFHSVQNEFDSDHTIFWSASIVCIVVLVSVILGVNAPPFYGLLITLYGWGPLPMSWYDFKEKKWVREEKARWEDKG